MKQNRSLNLDNQVFLFAGAFFFTALVFVPFFFVGKSSYIRLFLFRSWWIQSASTYLFGVGLCFLISKYRQIRREVKVAALIDINSMTSISSENARKELERVPAGLRETLAYRRTSELLKGYLNGEEVIHLNEELSRRDNEQIDRSHTFLDSIRQLIPVIGFLGTVLGLAMGMVAFPENMAKAATIENLRSTLQDFAASLSVAFETTVLALGYTIIIILLSTLLKERQAKLVEKVDRYARELVAKFRSRHQTGLAHQDISTGSDFESLLIGWLDRWEKTFMNAMAGFVREIRPEKQ